MMEYQIGDWVSSDHIVVFDYDKDLQRKAYKKNVKVRGQVVGGRYKPLGKLQKPKYNYEEPAYLDISVKTFVYLVREGFLNREVEVLPEDLIRVQSDSESVPRFKARQPKWTDQCRQWAREAALSQPRDEKGRFICER